MEDRSSLIKSFRRDTSPLLLALVRVSSPYKNLKNIAFVADITLYQVLTVASDIQTFSYEHITHPLVYN